MASIRDIKSAIRDSLLSDGCGTDDLQDIDQDLDLDDFQVTWAQVTWSNGKYIDALFYGVSVRKGTVE